MNPDNNALERTYFIGGPPRVGKSILAYALAEKIHGHVVSTDSIRNAAKKACSDKESDLFSVNKINDVPEKEWIRMRMESPQLVIDAQNKESAALWPSLVSFLNSFCEDDAVHIVEGVALTPSLISQMDHRPRHIVFIGNTSEAHAAALLEHSERFREKDWMRALGYSEEKILAVANFVKEMSLYFKSEAEKYGLPYFEMNDNYFDNSISEIVDFISG